MMSCSISAIEAVRGVSGWLKLRKADSALADAIGVKVSRAERAVRIVADLFDLAETLGHPHSARLASGTEAENHGETIGISASLGRASRADGPKWTTPGPNRVFLEKRWRT